MSNVGTSVLRLSEFNEMINLFSTCVSDLKKFTREASEYNCYHGVDANQCSICETR